jgi:hypothetical protein
MAKTDFEQGFPVNPRAAIASHFGKTGVQSYEGLMLAVNTLRHHNHPELQVRIAQDGTTGTLLGAEGLSDAELDRVVSASHRDELHIEARRAGANAVLVFTPHGRHD